MTADPLFQNGRQRPAAATRSDSIAITAVKRKAPGSRSNILVARAAHHDDSYSSRARGNLTLQACGGGTSDTRFVQIPATIATSFAISAMSIRVA